MTGSLAPAFHKNISFFFEFMERTGNKNRNNKRKKQKLTCLFFEKGQKMNALAHLAATGHLRAVVDTVVPFDNLPKGKFETQTNTNTYINTNTNINA